MAYKITDSCVACGTCIGECPVEAISAGDIYVIDADKCIDCGTAQAFARAKQSYRSNSRNDYGKCGPSEADRIFHSHNRYTLPT